MSNAEKIAIVAALVAAVVIVIAVKQTKTKTSRTDRLSSNSTMTQQTANLPRLVELGGQCTTCKLMREELNELKAEYPDCLIIDIIDIEANPDLAEKYNIMVIPTQIFFDASSKELFRHEGFMSKDDISDKWKELGVELKAK